MINIDVITDTKKEPEKFLKKIEKLKGITLLCEPDYFESKDTSAYTIEVNKLIQDKNLKTGFGVHYIIDANNILNTVPDTLAVTHRLNEKKQTYISKAMYDGKPDCSSIYILMLLPEGQKYEDIEKKTIKFIAKLIIDNKLTPDCFMRGFDLIKSATPLHLLTKDKWREFVKRVSDTYTALKDDKFKDEDLENLPPILKNEEVQKLYVDHIKEADKYAKQFEPDNRGIKALLDKQQTDSKIQDFETNNKTNFTYQVQENAPSSSDHCARAYDTLTAKATPDNLEVEPIYPDIIVPPGGSISLVDGIKATAVSENSSVSLSVSDFEKRQKAFNIKDYANTQKTIKGKPVNNNDAYPVDLKIKELESHMPKVKVDEVNFQLHDCNHPQSLIGASVSKNFAMIQDEIITVSKRTERRLVKLENQLSTVMRNLFRVSSRININCVYYGGQDVYSKWKCIRCLHNDRVADGQSMTLDQCLSCTRYEPILGQVYAILDETGTNISQVLDDMQMSYMGVDEYVDFTRTENMHKERKKANLLTGNKELPKHEDNIKDDKLQPEQKLKKAEEEKKRIIKEEEEVTGIKRFEQIWDEGFKMNWADNLLETHTPNIAEYKMDDINPIKPTLKADTQKAKEPEFKDTREKGSAYETLKFNSEDYNFNEFGEESSSSSYVGDSFGMGAAQIRGKIVEQAKAFLKLCQDGHMQYSQPNRGQTINGVLYHDCSSMTAACYKAAGLSFGSTTMDQYPMCYSKAGGKLIPIKDEKDALPGDAIFFASYPATPDELHFPANPDELPMGVATNGGSGGIGHIAVYIGNGEFIEAASSHRPPTKQICLSKIRKGCYCFARPKCLVEADKVAAASLSSGDGYWSNDFHQFDPNFYNNANRHLKGDIPQVISNMKKYGYKDAILKKAKEYNFDPYMILGLIATESGGNPCDRDGGYWGVMQTEANNTRATSNISDIEHDIDVGCRELKSKMNALKGCGWSEDICLVLHAYNAGEGNVIKAMRDIGFPKGGSEKAKGGKVGNAIGTRCKQDYGWSFAEKSEYFCKILARYIELKKANALT